MNTKVRSPTRAPFQDGFQFVSIRHMEPKHHEEWELAAETKTSAGHIQPAAHLGSRKSTFLNMVARLNMVPRHFGPGTCLRIPTGSPDGSLGTNCSPGIRCRVGGRGGLSFFQTHLGNPQGVVYLAEPNRARPNTSPPSPLAIPICGSRPLR